MARKLVMGGNGKKDIQLVQRQYLLGLEMLSGYRVFVEGYGCPASQVSQGHS